MTSKLKIGTRGSPLALWQADHVAALLRQTHPHLEVERVVIRTKGDRILNQPLADIGDKGLFTRELERAQLDGEVDIAVHSMKDVPSEDVPGLVLAAVPMRGPVEDALVAPCATCLDELPPGAVVATGSLRRRAQLLFRRPDLQVVDVRGNVHTRLRKLDEEGWDGMILARAGLERLGLSERIAGVIAPSEMLPAVGQGALFIQAAAESHVLELVRKIEHRETALALRAERSFMRVLEGGCQVPIGALARVEAGELRVEGFVGLRDGSKVVRETAVGSVERPESVGELLAEKVLAVGGGELLSRARLG